MEEGLKLYPPFKGFGMKMIEFGLKEPALFKALFHSSHPEWTYDEFLRNQMKMDRLVPYVISSFDVDEKEARWMIGNIFLHVCGMIDLQNSGAFMAMREEEMSHYLGSLVRGMLLHIKTPSDERTRIMPGEVKEIGSLNEYLKGKKNVIVGYGPEKEIYQLRIDAILYFEAVGEKVFAYTKSNVYEIKHRLYQVEEKLKAYGFIRISKSMLINASKIASIASEGGGRGRIHMTNGESVIASRAYYGKVKEMLDYD